jgi:hypothetical protein
MNNSAAETPFDALEGVTNLMANTVYYTLKAIKKAVLLSFL